MSFPIPPRWISSCEVSYRQKLRLALLTLLSLDDRHLETRERETYWCLVISNEKKTPVSGILLYASCITIYFFP